jgi:hypothetical protein
MVTTEKNALLVLDPCFLLYCSPFASVTVVVQNRLDHPANPEFIPHAPRIRKSISEDPTVKFCPVSSTHQLFVGAAL